MSRPDPRNEALLGLAAGDLDGLTPDQIARLEGVLNRHPPAAARFVAAKRHYDPGLLFRNAMWDEYHTLWVLPNAGLSITIVERATISDSNKEIGGGPRGMKAKKVEFVYMETRVEPLLRPAYKGGETGPGAAGYAARQRDGSGA